MGFEPTNGGFADQSWKCILLVRLAFTPAQLAGFGPILGCIVPKLFPLYGMNPCSETNSLGTHAAFIQPLLHLLAGEGVWGRGRHLSPLPINARLMPWWLPLNASRTES